MEMEYEANLITAESCSCKGSNLDKLIQPSVLILLSHHEKMHGYAIVQELEKAEPGGIDKAGVYRTLKLMEERDHISSSWEDEKDGPSKKMFSLTKFGYYCLMNWMGTLRDYRDKVDNIISEGRDALDMVKAGSGEVKLWD